MASSKDALAKENGKPSSDDSTAKDSFWTPGRVAITLIVGALIVWYGVAEWRSKGVQPTGESVVKTPSKTAPAIAAPPAVVPLPEELRNTALHTLDGTSLKLSDYGDKVVVVNIWATWCQPCRQEMPELIKMSNEYKARGLVVLGLATSYNERDDQQHVKDYVKAQNVPYQIIWDDGTLAGPLVEAVQGRAVIPQSFVISRDGRIVKHFTGFNVSSTPVFMRQAIEDALNDKGKA
ncbi:MAG: TlpA disulfide reductase family protein [Pyrinomonadaceae bacterium]